MYVVSIDSPTCLIRGVEIKDLQDVGVRELPAVNFIMITKHQHLCLME